MKSIDKRFLRFNLAVVLAAGTLLFAIVLATFAYTTKTEFLANNGLLASAINRRVQLLLNIVVDAETGQRGYLLTRDEHYLDPFRQALNRYDAEYALLEEQVAQLPSNSTLPDIAEFDGIVRQKFAELSQTVDLTRQGRFSEALDIVNTDTGQALSDRARNWVSAFSTSTAAVRSATVQGMRSSIGTLTMLTIATALLLLVLIAGAMFMVVRHTRELERARIALQSANAALGKANSELEERVLDRTRSLTRANEEVQRYAYIVSHDLRAPLVNIMGFTGEVEASVATLATLVRRMDDRPGDPLIADARQAIDEDIPEAIGFIRSSMARMDALINEILKLSRIGRRELEPKAIDLGQAVGRALETVQHKLTEAGATAKIEGVLPSVVSDRMAIDQIFANLFDNAVKYLYPSRPGRIVVAGRVDGAFVRISIADNGRGIAPADHERVFELFRRSGVQDRPGEGIGLAHVRSLVRRLGGDITVESDGRSGTTFQLTLARDLRSLLKGS